MNARKTIIAMAVTGAFGAATVLGTGIVTAAQPNNPETEATAATTAEAASPAATGKLNFQTAEEAFTALRQVRAARVAIFNGNPEQALELAAEATKNLETANKNVDKLAVKTTKKGAADDSYIPFDSSITLAEGFMPNDEKNAALEKANEHLTKGEHEPAMATLRMADIEISVRTALLPASSSLKHVQDAAKLMGEHKYYEANLALKAVEDSVVIEFYDVDAVPEQGSKG